MEFSDPKKNLKRFGIVSGMTVADLGAGSGFYTLEAAHMVGEEGRVYAIDIQRESLSRIKSIMNEHGLGHVHIIWGDAEISGGTKLADSSIDRAIASNILFQLEEKGLFVEELRRILKEGGRVLVVDWLPGGDKFGPTDQYIVPKDHALNLFLKNGFQFEYEFPAGERHYALVFKK